MAPVWITHQGSDLLQGDFLPNCLIPTFGPEFGKDGETETVPIRRGDLVIVTQSCDLANAKARVVALCPIFSLKHFESINPSFESKGRWEEVRKGRREGLHLLAGPVEPQNNRTALVVDFRPDFQSSVRLSLPTRGKPWWSLALAATVSGAFFSGVREVFYARWASLSDPALQVNGMTDDLLCRSHCISHGE